MGLNAIIDLLLNSAQFDSALDKSEKRIKGFAREAEKAGKIAGKIGAGLSVANVAGLEKMGEGAKLARHGIEGLTGALLLLGTVPLPLAIGIGAVAALASFALGASNAAEEAEKLHQRILGLTQSAEEMRDATMKAAQADLSSRIAASEKLIAQLESTKGTMALGGVDQSAEIAKQRAILTALQADYIAVTEKFNAEKQKRETDAAQKIADEKLAIQRRLESESERAHREAFERKQAFEEYMYQGVLETQKAQEERAKALDKLMEDEHEKAVQFLAEREKQMSLFADQAARNMQSAFANFLFDPFKDGLDGLLKNFLQVIQRMIAEAAAARIFESLGFSGTGGGALGGFLNGLIGKRASGGPVSAGKPYLVGEEGPEMFVPGSSGGIVPNHAMGGGPSIVINIDARNATDPAAIIAAGAIVERQVMGKVATMMRRGYVPGG